MTGVALTQGITQGTDIPLTTIPDPMTPLGAVEEFGVWAPVNIVLVVLSLLGCLLLILWHFRMHRLILNELNSDDFLQIANGADKLAHFDRSCFYLRILSVVAATLGVFVVALTQDLSGEIISFDFWTLILATLFLIQCWLMGYTYRRELSMVPTKHVSKRLSLRLF